MGIAVAKVTREALDMCLPILQAFGGLVSVHYPAWHGDPCEVRFITTAVPDDGEHPVRVTMRQEVDGNTVSLIAALKLIQE